MFIRNDLCAGESTSVDDRSVIETISKNHILFCDERRDGSKIGSEARLEGDDILRAFEFGKTLFELNMQINGARDGTHGRRTDTIFLRLIFCGFNKFGMIRQAEIIVRAEVEHILAIDDGTRALRRTERAGTAV